MYGVWLFDRTLNWSEIILRLNWLVLIFLWIEDGRIRLWLVLRIVRDWDKLVQSDEIRVVRSCIKFIKRCLRVWECVFRRLKKIVDCTAIVCCAWWIRIYGCTQGIAEVAGEWMVGYTSQVSLYSHVSIRSLWPQIDHIYREENQLKTLLRVLMRNWRLN